MKKIFVSHRSLLLLPGTALLLSACASMSKNELVGSSWEALQDIEFPRRSTTLRIQDGRVVEARRDRFVPYCEVMATGSIRQSLTIRKGARFNITRVNYSSSTFNVSTFVYETNIRVEAKDYPDIRTFHCRVWGSQTDRHMSTRDMQNTMKGLFALEK